MKDYTTVFQNECFIYEEKKSKFIANIYHIESVEDAELLIEKTRKQYFDARHNVFAFSLKDGITRSSDDGEPHGTAGKPILEIIEKSGVTDILIIVTRYFGGVLLGTGGLLRAYSESALGVLKKAKTEEVKNCDNFSLFCDYGEFETLSKIIGKYGKIKNTEFSDKVFLEFFLPVFETQSFINEITETFFGELKAEKKGQSFEKL